ncbi:MAG TPA: hypothetical protein VG326_07035 [Tepidisphaeraceae bacterium]|nr:hypothetical protein [Tepidisphaeraceae bacterium]
MPHRSAGKSGGFRIGYACLRVAETVGPQACPHGSSIREDKLINMVNSICHDILGDSDKAITAATKIGVQRMATGKAETALLNSEIRELDDRNKRLTRVLLDAEIDSVARRERSHADG